VYSRGYNRLSRSLAAAVQEALARQAVPAGEGKT
jgi:hypothetical protein